MLVSCAAVALLVATGHEALSQAPRATIAVGGGIATDARGVTSRAATVAPSLSWTVDPRLSFGVGASATRFGNEQWSLGGSGSTSARLALGAHAALTFDGAGAAATTSYDAAYETVDAVPALELRAGALTAFAGAHAAYGRSSLQSPGATPLGVIPGGSTTTAMSRSTLGALFGGSARVNSANETLVLGYREEHASVLHVPFADRTAWASVTSGPLTVSGSIGARSATDEHATFGSGAVSVALPGSMALDVGGGTYPSNRITGLPGGRYFSVGLSLHTGPGSRQRSAEVTLPEPRGVTPPLAGYTRLAIRADDATRVEVAGDWNRWTLVPAQRAADGTWYVDLKIAPGRYRYAFRVNGTTWRIPDGAAAVDDQFGGKSAWLTVRGPETAGIHDTMEER